LTEKNNRRGTREVAGGCYVGLKREKKLMSDPKGGNRRHVIAKVYGTVEPTRECNRGGILRTLENKRMEPRRGAAGSHSNRGT